jgi:ABC-2 type transport system ATP-binding protein
MSDVSRSFGTTHAVRDMALDVRPGEMFGLIGPDGAGKTTTIRLICGLLRADHGTIRVFDLDPIRDHRALTSGVGYFSQRFSLYGALTIDENIAFFAEIHGLAHYQDRRTRLLDMMQLTPFRDRLADRLSGGMKQKLALACTLIHEPRLIVLDEPTTGVDPVSRREFWRLLSEFLSEGITIVMATPYLDEAERCGRVALVSQGQVLDIDTPMKLRDSFVDDIVEVLASPQPAVVERLSRDPQLSGVQEFGERLHVRTHKGTGVDAAHRIRQQLEAANLHVTTVRPIPASLEDVFIERVTTSPAPVEVSS